MTHVEHKLSRKKKLFSGYLIRVPHQKEFCKHSSHDRFSGSLSCTYQELVPCGMQLLHAFPMEEVVCPLD